MLSLRSVSKSYGATVALADLDLDLASGEFFGLLGPNGAGKTTLMSILAGFRTPDAGTVTLDGADLLGDPEGIAEDTHSLDVCRG